MEQLLWTQRQDIGPGARSLMQMVYDAARDRVVLFGGLASDNNTFLNDTWEWDGEYWTQFADIGPSPRSRMALAYDSKRERVVLFGGVGGQNSNFNFLRDTWEWDGEGWTQVDETGPSARSGHSMAFDSRRGRVVLFGGNNSATLGDTWGWDGSEWTQEQDSGPPGRTTHAMDYDSGRDRMVLSGGQSISLQQVTETVRDSGASGAFGGTHQETRNVVNFQFFNDTWESDGLVWTRVADTGPEARIGSCLVYNGKTLLLFGGQQQNGGVLKDTWEWSGKRWTQRQDIGPAARAFAGIAYDKVRDRAVLFGGSAGQAAFGDTWEQFIRKGAVLPAAPPA